MLALSIASEAFYADGVSTTFRLTQLSVLCRSEPRLSQKHLMNSITFQPVGGIAGECKRSQKSCDGSCYRSLFAIGKRGCLNLVSNDQRFLVIILSSESNAGLRP